MFDAMFHLQYGCDQPTAEKPAAALRDASWFRCPSTYGRDVKVHVTENGYTAACNKNTPIISEELVAIEMVAPSERCQRPGCRSRWPHK